MGATVHDVFGGWQGNDPIPDGQEESADNTDWSQEGSVTEEEPSAGSDPDDASWGEGSYAENAQSDQPLATAGGPGNLHAGTATYQSPADIWYTNLQQDTLDANLVPAEYEYGGPLPGSDNPDMSGPMAIEDGQPAGTEPVTEVGYASEYDEELNGGAPALGTNADDQADSASHSSGAEAN